MITPSLIHLPHNTAYLTALPSDMANINVDWDVEGIIKAPESVKGMLKVVQGRTFKDTGTFWTWEGRVQHFRVSRY